MNWKPKTAEELASEELCPVGVYPFTVLEAADQKSKKSGKDMIKLKVSVHGPEDFDYHVYDYISPEFMHFKFRNFFETTGQLPLYESGKATSSSLVGLQGFASVIVQEQEGYPAKNAIKDYGQKKKRAEVVTAEPGPDDDVPF